MARRAGYSPFHFSRLFRRQTGQSPWQYVLDRKVEHAKELLLSTTMSVKEIAAELGFPNQDYFAKMFRKRCGAAPTVYRGRAGQSMQT
jgi:AraC family transcriptional regulator